MHPRTLTGMFDLMDRNLSSKSMAVKSGACKSRHMRLQVDVIVLPGFNLAELSAVLDVADAVVVSHPEIEICTNLMSLDGRDATAGDGRVTVRCQPLEFERSCGLAVLLGGASVNAYAEQLASASRRAEHGGRSLVVFSEAVGALISQGRFENDKVTVPWDDPISEQIPLPPGATCELLYIRDGKLTTCAGRLSAFEALIDVICDYLPSVKPMLIADRLKMADLRTPWARQRRALKDLYRIENRAFATAVERMELDLENTVRISEIARDVGMSTRQLERHFQRTFGISPVKFRRRKQVQKARWLIDNTGLTLVEVAVACGFSSASQLSKAFRGFWGMSPTESRDKQNIGLDQYSM